jgi:hypothetical protein
MSLSRDEQMARLSLTMDERELANLAAENARYERRKQAMQRGDGGSYIDPRSYDPAMPFTPVQCVTCGVKLTSQNHSAALTCHECVAHEERIQFNIATTAKFEEAQRAVRQAKKLSAAKRSALILMALLVVAVGAAVGLAWLLNKAFFAAGGAL